jgi:hypothetical protein
MEAETILARVPHEVKAQAWRLIMGCAHLEAHRVLTLALGDAVEAKQVTAYMIRRKLRIHN